MQEIQRGTHVETGARLQLYLDQPSLHVHIPLSGSQSVLFTVPSGLHLHSERIAIVISESFTNYTSDTAMKVYN